MAKGDDALMRKRNRSKRKKMRGKETVSARVAAIIASKRRRKTGKRRICEGMCFSLPTPEDPFNDRNDSKANKKIALDNYNGLKDKGQKEKKISHKFENKKSENSSKLVAKIIQHNKEGSEAQSSEACPSKFLTMCLNTIQSAWTPDCSPGHDDDKLFLLSKWGLEFWRHFSGGFNILDDSVSCAGIEQIAWLICTAADIITRKEKEGAFIPSPFLLYIVPSREKARKVRTICKPLKDLGLHTVCIHPAARIERQVHGLKSSEPEFLISTPERLLQLVSLGAINISEVALLVLDDFTTIISSGSSENVKSIRSLTVKNPQMVVFTNSNGGDAAAILSSLMPPPIHKLCRDDSP